MTKKREVQFPIRNQLSGLKVRWLAHANEAETYKNLYEEANLFVSRALERLPEDHPLSPLNYTGLVSDEYIQELLDIFDAQDAEPIFDPELDEIIGVQNDLVVDDTFHAGVGRVIVTPTEGVFALTEPEEFDIKEWNNKAFAAADAANLGEYYEDEKEEDTNPGVEETPTATAEDIDSTTTTGVGEGNGSD